MTRERQEAVMAYKASVTVFKNWLADGLISTQDYIRIEQILAVKYELSSCSIWRESP